MGVVTAKELENITTKITRLTEQKHSYEDEIEDMEGEVATLQEQIQELEYELEDIEATALEMGGVFETFFDTLVTGLDRGHDYDIERDPWIMDKRWGIKDAEFCCLIHARNSVYKCTDYVPNPDSVMTLVPSV